VNKTPGYPAFERQGELTGIATCHIEWALPHLQEERTMKNCATCGTPFSPFYHTRKFCSDACRTEKVRACKKKWAEQNIEKVRANRRKWARRNPATDRERQLKWRAKNGERVKEYQRQWREENRTYNSKWRTENRERIKERQREWRAENQESRLASQRKWRKKSRERIREARRQRYAEMANARPKAHPEMANSGAEFRPLSGQTCPTSLPSSNQ
jgi:hypothetical protein